MDQGRLEQKIADAARHFWEARSRQRERQGASSGIRDAGERSAVTGGAQMDGFAAILHDLVVEVGFPENGIERRRTTLPGWFRAEKAWDLVLLYRGRLVAAIELKSHVGPSFGNNFNNRTEESLGSATDLWASFREGAFAPGARPWLGFLMFVEDCPSVRRPVKALEPHFPVFAEFNGASYADRYQTLMTKLVRERLYDGACLLLSPPGASEVREPSAELSFARFVESLLSRALGALRAPGEKRGE